MDDIRCLCLLTPLVLGFIAVIRNVIYPQARSYLHQTGELDTVDFPSFLPEHHAPLPLPHSLPIDL
jgi:hypothetical protein